MTIDEATPTTAPAPTVDLTDVQGNILRGYNLPDVRHYALGITDTAGGKALLGVLLSGQGEIPPITTAAEWDVKPAKCLNIAITAPGLRQLGVPEATIETFAPAFVNGSAAQSVALAADPTSKAYGVGLGDIGDAAPDHWVLGGLKNPEVHLMVSLWTDEETEPCQGSVSAELEQLFAANGIEVISVRDGRSLDRKGKIHFGYRDGISQPQIVGRPGDREADKQPDVPTGDFLLGKDYVNTYGGNFQEGTPSELADNGTFAVFRILEQDVAAFEDFIERTGTRWDMHPELVAAKLVGRWRDGESIVMKPHRSVHGAGGDDGEKLPYDRQYDRDRPIPEDQLNDFDYAPTPEHPTNYDDDDGVRCPFGSHMRRMNPRGGAMGGIQHNHRIVRRGIPYGPEYDPENPDDRERGLLGVFICGDIATQFEFLQMTWANTDIGTPGVIGTRDPMIGWQPGEGGKFRLPTGDHRGTPMLTDLPRLVTTRGSVYGFMPGIAALRHLAGS